MNERRHEGLVGFSFQTEERVCPVCGSNAYLAEARQEAFCLGRCRDCSMLYTRNPPTLTSKLEYYGAMARHRMDSTSAVTEAFSTLANQIKSVPLYSLALSAIRNHFPQGSVNLVDVGCAGGLFLLGTQVVEDAFNIDRAPRFNVRGVAADPLEKKDTEMYAGCPVVMLDQAAEVLTDWADVVTMFNVLEHVGNPSGVLGVARQMLRDSGLLLVDVPNNQVVDWHAKVLGHWSHLDLGEHINYFTPQSLDHLMDRSSFRRVRRLRGLIQGASGFGTRPTAREWLRWLFASVAFSATCSKLHVFPHVTGLYTKNSHRRH